ncbi:hypothetical protein NQ318_010485 [Aromia moschata]|uniref:NADH dehydrogenase [ubiquinone] 1 beta subcomplex subunit 11, mitochondrial n=1 Tax=Aromia moschata TaxID=1265417 RepID=A0AAV8YB37_9CUCU|nr:hypothetical protein NQ318_010485 [Aromia moschata]
MDKIITHRVGLKRIVQFINRRFVSTSKKHNETATVDVCKPEAKVERDWVCYGFDYKTKAGDRNAMHSIMFVSITLCMTVGGFFLAYAPDFNFRDWSQQPKIDKYCYL